MYNINSEGTGEDVGDLLHCRVILMFFNVFLRTPSTCQHKQVSPPYMLAGNEFIRGLTASWKLDLLSKSHQARLVRNTVVSEHVRFRGQANHRPFGGPNSTALIPHTGHKQYHSALQPSHRNKIHSLYPRPQGICDERNLICSESEVIPRPPRRLVSMVSY